MATKSIHYKTKKNQPLIIPENRDIHKRTIRVGFGKKIITANISARWQDKENYDASLVSFEMQFWSASFSKDIIIMSQFHHIATCIEFKSCSGQHIITPGKYRHLHLGSQNQRFNVTV